MAVFISSSGSPGRATATTTTTTTLLLAVLAAAAAAGLLLAPVAARGSPPEHDKQLQLQQQEDDRILGLPGQPNGVAFGMYGGYVTIDDNNGRALYYWFQEADTADPAAAPLVLWLNGGPGCSSIGLGAMQELGAFRVHTNGESLLLNEYAWNKESPAGVGFSYSNTSSDLSMGDDKMAQDTYTFLVKWFERFPHYKYREFYIAGESGHFIPQLSQVVYRNRNNSPFINFQGLLVSSGLTNDHEDMIGMFESWWHHGLISDETRDSGLKVCPGTSFMHPTPECTEVWNKALAEQGNINPYTIYTPTCDREPSPYQRRFWAPHGRAAPPPLMLPPYDPCAVFNSINYLNLPEVQTALHANVSGIVEYPWTVCSNTIFDQWGQAADDLLPVYRELIQAGLRVWVYSGDTDSVVPVSSTRRSLAALELPVKTSWYPWYMAPTEREVGGWSVQYEGLTYVTVRGAGHLVPVHRPAQAFLLFKQFLKGEPMPAEEKNDILLPSEKAPFY
ncbi:hypothetical protein BDA96_04G358900 [Sorghum bicolor]|uniref:Uncharacterized protein n=2 Tax=Sorghum bicolor TaxID=4558 RepID=A0A921R7Z7_SORBI|nr:hypothetical protein BDA96_04G358900 [Sorghum bicolor]